MKETRQDAIDRLHVGTLLAGCGFMTYGLVTVITQHVQRASPGIGVWMRIDGQQAVLIGLIMIASGIAAGWSCYLKRAIDIFPNWKKRIYLVSIVLVLIMLLSNAMLFTPGIADKLRPVLFVSCMISVVALAIRVHSLLKKRIKQEIGQPGGGEERR
jgi:hypothetical protein